MRSQRTACRNGGERGRTPNILKEMGGGGGPPEQARTPFVRSLIQEMGGNPQDLISPPPEHKTKRGAGDTGERPGRDPIWGGRTSTIRGGEGRQKSRPELLWLGSLTSLRGAAHIVAKTRQHTNKRPNITEGPGDGAVEAGGEGEVTGI